MTICQVFINLKKPFDNVNHDAVLEKSEYFDIHGLANKWLSSFLQNCKQYVSFHGVSTNIKIIPCSVLQGSILDLLLFFYTLMTINVRFQCQRSTVLQTILILYFRVKN